MLASPMTCTFGTCVDSKVSRRTGHQPESSASPAASAISPARCGGMTLITSPPWVSPKRVVTRIAPASTEARPPSVSEPGTHVIMPS